MPPSSPPSFADLGAAAREAVEEGICDTGAVGLSSKTRSAARLETLITGNREVTTGLTTAGLESSWTSHKGGLKLSNIWGTDGILKLGIDVEPLEGAQACFSSTLATKPSDVILGAGFHLLRPNIHFSLTTDFTVPLSNPVFRAAAVFARNGWIFGAESVVDSATRQVTDGNVSLGYRATDIFMLHSRVNAFEWMLNANVDASKISWSVYQLVGRNLKTGACFSWDADADTKRNLSYDLAAHYNFHKDACISAKVNQHGLVRLGLQFLLFKGVTANLGLDVEVKNLDSLGDRIGFRLQFEQ